MTTSKGDQPSAFAPLRHQIYRYLWLAILFSNIGTWMQTVGAQWLLVDEPNAEVLVSLVQTAGSLPVFFLAIPAGVLADTFDRRRLLIGVQAFQVAVTGTLTALMVADRLEPSILLLLTLLIGVGLALNAPAWQSSIPELVPRRDLSQASTLGAMSMNTARVVGPAIAGLLIARLGVTVVFAFNAVSFLAYLFVLLRWRHDAAVSSHGRERFGPALRAGARYVRHSPIVRRYLIRTASFVAPAMAVWALLPVVAVERLGLEASGYGGLLGAMGAGAVVGAFVQPRLLALTSRNNLISIACFAFAAALVLVVLVDVVLVAGAALVVAGLAWVSVVPVVAAGLQLFLPNWVRARGLSMLQMCFFGSQAAGAFLAGQLASSVGLTPAFLTSAVFMVATGISCLIWPLHATDHLDRRSVIYWDEPDLIVDPEPTAPVLVSLTYRVTPENETDFLDAMRRVRRSRRRNAALRWNLYRHGKRPNTFVEQYVVDSWEEHMRQHHERLTPMDQAAEDGARRYADGPPEIQHLFPVDGARAPVQLDRPSVPDGGGLEDASRFT